VTNESAPGLVFSYPQDATAAPTVPGNVDAARVNAFYIVNTIHDLSYRYGFTEVRIWLVFASRFHGRVIPGSVQFPEQQLWQRRPGK
jgi:hypothetical protein